MDDNLTTYALLIYRTTRDELPAAAREDALAGHRALQNQTVRRGELRAVAQLDEVSSARTIIEKDGRHEVTDGPYIETKEWLAGFYLVDCKDEEEALSRGRMICFKGDHVIEVRPVAWTPAKG